MILHKTRDKERPFGIVESEFMLLDDREKMITKMPVRLTTISELDLRNRKVFWDIGFCTGSVSIEVKLQFPHLEVIAFEVREKCIDIIGHNARKFGAVGIKSIIGDFVDTDINLLPRPDAVFIGGHGGKLRRSEERRVGQEC